MEATQLLLTSSVKETICSHLTFEEAINFRDALGLTSLKCPISVIDPESYNKKIILPGVNSSTIKIVELIKKIGLNAAFVEAARNGDNLMVKTLLSSKAINVNATGLYEGKALVEAARNGHNSVVQTLLAAGADVNIKAGTFGETALMVAAFDGNNSIVQTLINAGADVNIKGGQFGRTALDWAIKRGHQETIQILRTAGAQ